MKIYLDCVPCIYRQALQVARLASLTEDVQKQIVVELSKNMEAFLSNYIPPEIMRLVYDIINKLSPIGDVYKKIKEQSNEFALKIYPQMKKKVVGADQGLLLATELAIAGNIIDYGAKNSLEVDNELNKLLNISSSLLPGNNKKIFDFISFATEIENSKTILYIADNAGEVVFDRLLIETIKQHNSMVKIYYAIKEKPIINDALMEDAMQCGIDKIATVISSGSALSGTILSYCNNNFLDLFHTADLVISKGQGNFEGLREVDRAVFFLLIAKCPVIAAMINTSIGEMILYHKNHKIR